MYDHKTLVKVPHYFGGSIHHVWYAKHKILGNYHPIIRTKGGKMHAIHHRSPAPIQQIIQEAKKEENTRAQKAREARRKIFFDI